MLKFVSKELCDERHKNISDKLDDLKISTDKIMENHLPHIQKKLNSMDRRIVALAALMSALVMFLKFFVK